MDISNLSWPEPGEANDESGLGCNRAYIDLRRLSWGDAKRVFAVEKELIARIESSDESEMEYERFEEELWDELFGLDLGVASTVVCLSAARCVPFASCNAGAFGRNHQEVYPLVAFFARPSVVHLLLAAATDADIGLEDQYEYLIAYADEVRKLCAFAESLLSKRSSFRAIRLGHRPTGTSRTAQNVEQYKLPLILGNSS